MNNFNYTVRVELHHATLERDYMNLHSYMAKAGFYRTIWRSGVQYSLPWAEYIIASPLTPAQILALAKNAADLTGRSNSILLTQGIVWDFDGLQRT